jgi:tripartite ATP-independent transporter DctP family solute receptor
MKPTKMFIVSVLIVVLLSTMASGAPIVIRYAHHLSTATEIHETAELFSRLLSEKTNGAIKVQIVPGAQFGGQREIIEGVSFGTIEMGYGESGLYANWVPMFGVIGLPFLYQDYDHWIQMANSPVAEELEEALRHATGMRIVNWIMGGYRDIYTNRQPITRPEELKGLMIRLPEAPVFVDSFRFLGARPAPIPAPEMYTALQTGVVDAMEGTEEVGYTYKIYEVAKYLSRTRHILLDGSSVINENFFQSLSPAHQQALLEAAREAQEVQWADHQERQEMRFNQLKETKLIVNDVDHDAFLKAIQPFYEEFGNQVGGYHIIQAILQLR